MGNHRSDTLKTALITTTINVPRNLAEWANHLAPGDVIVIAGDRKTPHDEVVTLLSHVAETYRLQVRYLDPDAQDENWGVLSKLIGWNTIQRRNFATLWALRYDPDVIVTVDDDNWPTRDPEVTYASQLADAPTKIQTGPNGWANACAGLRGAGPIWHRGYPRWLRDDYWDLLTVRNDNPTVGDQVGVVASLWFGDPDVDALDRYAHVPRVYGFDANQAVTLNSRTTWCPFNSQATAFRAALAPALLYWPHVGRYDDIWASFVAQKIMSLYGLHTSFGRPLVRQDRDEHTDRDFGNFLKDLENEIFGMKHNGAVIAAIRGWEGGDPELSVLDNVSHLFFHVAQTCDFLPDETLQTFDEWVRVLRGVTRIDR